MALAVSGSPTNMLASQALRSPRLTSGSTSVSSPTTTVDWAKQQSVWGNTPYYSSVSIGPYIGTGDYNRVPTPIGGQYGSLASGNKTVTYPGPINQPAAQQQLLQQYTNLYSSPSYNAVPAGSQSPTGSPSDLATLANLANALSSGDRATIQRSLDALLSQQKLSDTSYANQNANNALVAALKKQGIDLSIYNAQREMGRAGQSYNLQQQGTADYINTQGNLTNMKLGDLNVQAAGQQREIAYRNQLVQLAAQALGLDSQQYQNIQNLLNSRQQNLNTNTNIQGQQQTIQSDAQMRNQYDQAVANGALTSIGQQKDLRDIQSLYNLAQQKLAEDQRSGTAEIGGQRTQAGVDYGKSENQYQQTAAYQRNQAAQAADQIKLLESQGSQIRTTYGYNTREAQRTLGQNKIQYESTLDKLGTQVGQWGIDKKIIDAQLQDTAQRLGIQQQMDRLTYLDKAGALNDSLNSLYQNTILKVAQYMPIVQQNPWMYQVIVNSLNSPSGTTKSASTSVKSSTGLPRNAF